MRPGRHTTKPHGENTRARHDSSSRPARRRRGRGRRRRSSATMTARDVRWPRGTVSSPSRWPSRRRRPCWGGPRTERPLRARPRSSSSTAGREETVEARVSLDAGAVTAWRRRNDIQPMAVVSELMEAEEARAAAPGLPGGDGAARRDRLRHGAGRCLAGGPLRAAGRDRPAAVPGGRVHQAAPRRQRVGPSRRRRDRARRPEHARGAAGGRPRRGADPAGGRQLRRRDGRRAPPRRHRAARDHAARRARGSRSTAVC